MMFGLSYLKLGIAAVILLAVMSAVTYHFAVVANLDGKITTLTKANGILQDNVTKLTASNESLQKANDQLIANAKLMITELANINAGDKLAQDTLRATQDKIRSRAKQQQAARVRSNPAEVEMLIDKANASAGCDLLTFNGSTAPQTGACARPQ